MFDDLRNAFREAVQNFSDELHRDEAPDTVDRLFLGMKHELSEAKDLLASLEKQIEQARAQAGKDADEEATCRRRSEMAKKVGDEETARIATEYAVKYERRRTVLEKKIVALDEERMMRVVEIDEMTIQITEAQKKRDELAAAAGASDTDDAIRAADDLFAEIDRMAGEMGEARGRSRRAAEAYRQSQAMDELEREFRDLRVDPWAPVPRRELDPDAALEELKRRMQQKPE